MARGLLENDHEWRIFLEKAIAMQPGMACCQLLVVILLTDEVAEPHVLWDQFKARLCDDVKHKLHHMNHYQADQEILEDDVYDYSLWDLNRILVGMGRSLANFLLMPLPQQQQAHKIPNLLLQAEQYNVDKMVTKFILFPFIITPPLFLMTFFECSLHSCYSFFSCLIMFQDKRHIQKYLKHVYSQVNNCTPVSYIRYSSYKP